MIKAYVGVLHISRKLQERTPLVHGWESLGQTSYPLEIKYIFILPDAFAQPQAGLHFHQIKLSEVFLSWFPDDFQPYLNLQITFISLSYQYIKDEILGQIFYLLKGKYYLCCI